MGSLGNHPNVLGLLGAVTEHMVDGQLFMVMELCQLGSLVDYLRSHRKVFVNQMQYVGQREDGDGYLVPRSSRIEADLAHSYYQVRNRQH